MYSKITSGVAAITYNRILCQRCSSPCFRMINNVYSCTEPAFDAKANAALSIINLFLIKGRESGLQSGDVFT